METCTHSNALKYAHTHTHAHAHTHKHTHMHTHTHSLTQGWDGSVDVTETIKVMYVPLVSVEDQQGRHLGVWVCVGVRMCV